MKDFKSLNKNDFKFGINGINDAAKDLSWSEKMHAVVGAIIQSKFYNEEFDKALLKDKEKIVYHPIVSGLDNIFNEGVPTIDKMFANIRHLIYEGFNPKQIVLRICPIIPRAWVNDFNEMFNTNYIETLRYILNTAQSLGIKRVRHSFLTLSSDVLDHFKTVNSKFVLNDGWVYDFKNEISLTMINNNFVYETDDMPFQLANHYPIISNEDLFVLGLDKKYKVKSFKDFPKNLLELTTLPEGTR